MAGNSLEDALNDAYEEHVEDEVTDVEVKTPASEAPLDESKPEGAETGDGRVRGKDGKFAPKDAISEDKQPIEEKAPVTGAPKPPGASPAPSSAPAQQSKAPVSWRPEVREKFGALPAEVQAEVQRREREVDTALRQSADSRRFTDEFTRAISPYEAMLRAENASPIAAVQNLFNTAYLLRTAPPQQKATMIAQMIGQFGVDVNMLDEVLAAQLSGTQVQQRTDPTHSFLQKELEPIKQFIGQFSTAQQQANTRRGQEIANEIETFKATAEFWNDVEDDVADLLEIAAKNKRTMTLQDAYSRATLAHPTIGEIIANRKLEGKASQQSAAARRSRNASASIPSGGAPEQRSEEHKPRTLDSAIEAAWDAVESRSNS